MKNRKLVSIIIPIYNVEAYLGECLESVIMQTYTQLEIICVYDPSSDKSIEILKKYANRDGRIQVISNERRMGLSYNRNIGLSQAVGDYLYFLDSDDWIEKNAIEELVNIAEETECDVIAFSANVFYESDRQRETHPFYDGVFRGVYPELMKGLDALNHFSMNG